MTARYRLWPYLIALATSVAAYFVRDGVESLTGTRSPYLLFVAAAALSAWYAGFRPGLLTTFTLFLVGYFHPQPDDAPSAQFLRHTSFLLSATAICLIVREMRHSRRQAETHAATAEAAERSLHAILESTSESVLSLNRDLFCTYVNETAARQAGRNMSDLVGKKPWEILPQLGSANARAALLRAATERRSVCFEERFEPSGGWSECNVYPAGNGVNLFVRDITAHKTAEANRAALALEMETERERLATIIHDLPVAVLLISNNFTIEIANPQAKVLFGENARAGQDYKNIKNGMIETKEGLFLESEERPVQRTMKEGKVFSNMEVEYAPPNGPTRSLIMNCIPLKNAQGEVRAVLATYTDITSLRTTQQALAASEHRLRFLFRSPSIGIFSGENETITDANPAFLNMLGYTLDEFHSGAITWTGLTPPEFAQRDAKAVAQLMSDGFCEPFEKQYIAKDGRRVPVLIGAVSSKPGVWTPWAVWVLDLTERHRLEERLRQRAKLESVGILAGGVAHDFNNLLTSILGNSTLAAEQLPEGSETRELLEHAILATERATDLTRQLLAYAGKGRFVIRPVDVSALVNETFAIVRTSIAANVECRLHLAKDLPPVAADATQIQQLVMNLIINAGEAIGPDPGVVEVETGTIRIGRAGIPDQQIEANLVPGRYVLIRVRDTGCGMDELTQCKIFDPFFTTKFTGRGLGLAAAQGIARSHRGAISVKTAPGAGSTFLVLLPAGDVPPTSLDLAPEMAASVN